MLLIAAFSAGIMPVLVAQSWPLPLDARVLVNTLVAGAGLGVLLGFALSSVMLRNYRERLISPETAQVRQPLTVGQAIMVIATVLAGLALVYGIEVLAHYLSRTFGVGVWSLLIGVAATLGAFMRSAEDSVQRAIEAGEIDGASVLREPRGFADRFSPAQRQAGRTLGIGLGVLASVSATVAWITIRSAASSHDIWIALTRWLPIATVSFSLLICWLFASMALENWMLSREFSPLTRDEAVDFVNRTRPEPSDFDAMMQQARSPVSAIFAVFVVAVPALLVGMLAATGVFTSLRHGLSTNDPVATLVAVVFLDLLPLVVTMFVGMAALGVSQWIWSRKIRTELERFGPVGAT